VSEDAVQVKNMLAFTAFDLFPFVFT